MLRKVNKKAVSPIIATVLLIVIALIIAIIIFLWAKSFIGEKTQKFGEPVENSCGNVNFAAEVSGTDLDVVNKGNVPLYGVEIRGKDAGTVLDKGSFTKTINIGETSQITGVDFSGVNDVLVVPMIVGESGEFKRAYTCDVKYAQEVTVA